jgi:xanthine dehydrogenase accessory factor
MVLVMTHDHALDFDLVAACLQRSDLPFVGLIGSDTKRARFASRLHRVGLPIDRLVCPIGLPGIDGKDPAVIAVSVVAQILQRAPHTDVRQTPMSPQTIPDRTCSDSACDECARQKVAR